MRPIAMTLLRRCAAVILALLALPVLAQSAYPTKSIRLVVPFPPGAGTDTVARFVAQKLSERLGQPFVIENKPGAATIIGNDTVVKAAPDGHTLLFAAAPIAMNTVLGVKTPYDVARDLAPISLVASGGAVIFVPTASPYRSLKDVVQAAKASPNGLNYATAGVGSMPHLVGEAWRVQTDANLIHVGYKGSTPALQDVLAGTVGVLIDGYIPSGAQIETGKLRALAYASPKRSPLMPNVPTIAEAGVPGYAFETWFMVFAPAGTPKPVIDKLNASLTSVLQAATVTARMAKEGFEPTPSTPAAAATRLQAEMPKWAKLVRERGITAE